MTIFVLFFCCTIFGPSRRRKVFTKALGVRESIETNTFQVSVTKSDSYITESNQDGVIMKVLPDYGEIQV